MSIPTTRRVPYLFAIALRRRCTAFAVFYPRIYDNALGESDERRHVLPVEDLARRNANQQMEKVERDAQILACAGLHHVAML
jgi:hypothetical protein